METARLELSTAGSAGAKITLKEAKEMIGAYKAKIQQAVVIPGGLKPIMSLKIRAKFLRDLTSREECEYVRFFVAQQPHPIADGKLAPRAMLDDQTLVIVGVDAKGKNLTDQIYEDLGVCPTGCDDPGGQSI